MKTVCVLFGGMSGEYEISCLSASYVVENLDQDKYTIIKVGITREGAWRLFSGSTQQMRDDSWTEGDCLPCILSPDREDHGLLVREGDGLRRIALDVIFPVLHGTYGEDGSAQGLFDLSGIPYVGSGVAASALGMDKAFSNMIFDTLKIPQAGWLVFDDVTIESDPAKRVEEQFSYPCFVKPANTGSSVGVFKAHNRQELCAALAEAAKVDKKVLVEEFVDGRELECAVLGNADPEVSSVGEVLPAGEFYDYTSKYHDEASRTVIPADIPPKASDTIREYAKRAYCALGCRGLSRADFFLGKNGTVYINELNTLPGFTTISMYGKLWEYEGVSYSALLDRMIALAEEE